MSKTQVVYPEADCQGWTDKNDSLSVWMCVMTDAHSEETVGSSVGPPQSLQWLVSLKHTTVKHSTHSRNSYKTSLLFLSFRKRRCITQMYMKNKNIKQVICIESCWTNEIHSLFHSHVTQSQHIHTHFPSFTTQALISLNCHPIGGWISWLSCIIITVYATQSQS